MVLCQIVINSATYSLYAINTFGRKNIKLLRIDYRFGVGADKLIYLESNILRLPLSNFPFFVFSSNSSHQVGNINGNIEFEDTTLNGNFDLRICDYATRLEPTDFVQLVLTLDITDK